MAKVQKDQDCQNLSLDWPSNELLGLADSNIHIDKTKKLEKEDSEEESEDDWGEEEETADDDKADDVYELGLPFDAIENWEDEEEEEEIPLSPKASLADVEGAIPKIILRKLPNSVIRKKIISVKKLILMLETENYLYEKTIEKLEASEKEIDSRIPAAVDEEFEDHLKKTRVMICESEEESDMEVNNTGVFEEVPVPIESQDVFYGRTITSLAPLNYDVMYHKYGEYVGTAAEKMDFGGEPKVRSRLNTLILQQRTLLDDKMSSQVAPKTEGDKASDRKSKTDQIAEGEDFSDFNFVDAKKLSLTDRLRFALEEEEEFRNRFYKQETQALKDEGAIQVHINAHEHALALLMGIKKDFELITNGSTGNGMNGKVMSDLLVKFRRKMKNQLSAEETRARITIRKVMAQRRRIKEQLNLNKEAVGSISHIDFEYLLSESSVLEQEIAEMTNTLKHLKDLTTEFHLVLQEEKLSLDRMVEKEGKMNKELVRRHDLVLSFHKSYLKCHHQISEATLRIDIMRKTISESQAPQPIDYIRLRETQQELENEVQTLERKLEEMRIALSTVQRDYDKCYKYLPGGKTVEEENQEWLDEIKRECKEKKLIRDSKAVSIVELEVMRPHRQTVEFDDDEEDSSDPPIHTGVVKKIVSHHSGQVPRQTMSARASLRARNSKVKSMQSILTQPRRFDSFKALHRRSKTTTYDYDFDMERASFVEQDLDDMLEPVKHQRDSNDSEEA